ncbi:MAG: response regulator [Chloroflexi bacterium]|uniref:Response regulator n=1 Tax=Candidatus Chlorohelix allophototropha TaxID=3003348 RepID=A0A8T7M7E8_9CHLR|nr:response regulator [Chloroflexota bacterium]WJW68011.1 response regulator [Chloroflexota bacterium L227-S17]
MEKKVLVIEDSLTQAIVLKRELEKQGYIVVLAYDGMKGLEAVASFHPDVIVLDLNIPRMDGIEVCKRLKHQSQVEWIRTIPVLMFSAQTRLSTMNEAYKAGADHFVTKDREGAGFLNQLLEATFRRIERRRATSKLSLKAYM